MNQYRIKLQSKQNTHKKSSYPNSNMQTTRVVDLSCKQVTGSPAYVRS